MKAQIPLAAAEKLARKIVQVLGRGCDRIEVAGSIRRQARTCGDIEIVAIPTGAVTDLLGNPAGSRLDPILAELMHEGRLQRGTRMGDRYRQYVIPAGRAFDCPSLTLDLYIVSPEAWGVQLAIRTGCSIYSRALVTQRREGGLLDDGLRVGDHDRLMEEAGDGPADLSIAGRAYRYIETPEERDFLAHAGGWIDPPDRGPDAAGKVRTHA